MGQLFSLYTSDRSAAWRYSSARFGHSRDAHDTVLFGSLQLREETLEARQRFRPTPPGGLLAVQPEFGYSGVYVPSQCSLKRNTFFMIVREYEARYFNFQARSRS